MMVDRFPSTRQDALQRLEEFVSASPRYAARRNFVHEGHPHVSRLSPAIRDRLLTEQEVVERVLAAHSFSAVEKFVQEVLWRSYWKGWLELRPQVWTSYRERLNWVRQQTPEPVLQQAREVAAGQSGVGIMDRLARELVTTGYLHNHARMWWASFWIHVERLPWELGADFFERHLLDFDPASNTLSWRWVAGLQTPGKTYLVRRSNLEKYADPAWLTDEAGLTRLDDSRVTPAEVEEFADTRPQALPLLPENPPNSARRTGVWLHAEDSSVEESSLKTLPNPALLGFSPEPDQVGLVPRAWRAAAQADSWSRGLAHFDPQVSKACTEPGDWEETLVKLAGELGVARLVAFAPAVGPLADRVPSVRRQLEAAGVELVLLRRPWDSRLWPLARRGFFDFWQRVQVDLRRGKPETEQGLLPGLV